MHVKVQHYHNSTMQRIYRNKLNINSKKLCCNIFKNCFLYASEDKFYVLVSQNESSHCPNKYILDGKLDLFH